MLPRRLIRELFVLGCSSGGAAIGYGAGSGLEPAVQLVTAFLGMALLGAFAEFCLSRR